MLCRVISSRDWVPTAIIVEPTSILRFLSVTSFRSRKGEGIRFEEGDRWVVLRSASMLSMLASLYSSSSSTQGIGIGGAIEKYLFNVSFNRSTVSVQQQGSTRGPLEVRGVKHPMSKTAQLRDLPTSTWPSTRIQSQIRKHT